MKNGEQPAFARSYAERSDINLIDEKSSWAQTGLTKREYFAALALQGILSAKYEYDPIVHRPTTEDTIIDALKYADELLRQLGQ